MIFLARDLMRCRRFKVINQVYYKGKIAPKIARNCTFTPRFPIIAEIPFLGQLFP
jgi:hypothetical protein